jgi:hypothetical protein
MYTTGTKVNNYVRSTQKCKNYNIGRAKAISLPAWTGADVSGSLKSQISRQSEYEGDKFVSRTHRPSLPPPEIVPILISDRG